MIKALIRKDRLPGTQAILALSVLLLITITFSAIWFSNQIASHDNEVDEMIATEPITFSTDQPSEEEPDDNYQWQGSSDDPKYIRLPSIDSGGYIQNVGIDQNQQIAVPDNVHKAGWFINSVRPGEMGLSIIDGHVDGATSRNGIFMHLEYINSGDEFEIEMGDGRILTYRVMEVVSMHESEAASVLFSQHPQVSHQVNLITCGGLFDQESRSYDERVIVSAELVS